MYTPLPSILELDSVSIFLNLVERSTTVPLRRDDIFLDIPVKTSRTGTLINITPQPHMELKGVVEVAYERIDLNVFFFGIPITIQTDNLINKDLVTNTIKERWSLNLEENDYELHILDYGVYLPKKLTLTAKEESLVWVGELEIWVVGNNHIGNVFNKYSISFNTFDNIKRNAFIYSYERNIHISNIDVINYLEEGTLLSTLDLDTAIIINELVTATGDNWVITEEPSDYNLNEAKVIYHGIIDSQEEENMIVITLGGKCNNLFGNLILRYTPNIEGEI